MANKFNINSIYQVGKRERNEDTIFPNEEITTSLDNLFLVCDGVGGQAKGEIASDLVCTQLNSFFVSNKIEVSDEKTIHDAIVFVETKFDSYIVANPQSAGMASTLTLLHLHKAGATVAHIGDSRVYQFRDGEIVFRTKDHSFVQQLFDLGEITTEEEMAKNPRRNEITRALQGASIRKTKADVSLITDIKAGDVFFLCTDGVLESFSDKELKKVFVQNNSIDTIAAIITMQCEKTSKDNYSAYFVQVNQEFVEMLDIAVDTLDIAVDKHVADTETKKIDEYISADVPVQFDTPSEKIPKSDEVSCDKQAPVAIEIEETKNKEHVSHSSTTYLERKTLTQENTQQTHENITPETLPVNEIPQTVTSANLNPNAQTADKNDELPAEKIVDKTQKETIGIETNKGNDIDYYYNEQKLRKERKKRKLFVGLILLIVLLALLGAGAYMILEKPFKPDVQNNNNAPNNQIVGQESEAGTVLPDKENQNEKLKNAKEKAIEIANQAINKCNEAKNTTNAIKTSVVETQKSIINLLNEIKGITDQANKVKQKAGEVENINAANKVTNSAEELVRKAEKAKGKAQEILKNAKEKAIKEKVKAQEIREKEKDTEVDGKGNKEEAKKDTVYYGRH